MAKFLGIGNPVMRGRVGNIVYKVRKAETIASAYQPVVHDAKSELQILQRNRFKNSVNFAKQIMAWSQEMYGTGKGAFEYQGVMKTILNSMQIQLLYRNVVGGNLIPLPNSTYSFNADLLRNVTKAVGQSYDNEGLNIFDPNVTLFVDTTTVVNDNKESKCGILIDDTRINQTISPKLSSAVFFGCDYLLPSTLALSQIKNATVEVDGQMTSNIISSSDDLSFTGISVKIAQVEESEENLIGYRRRGFFTEIANVGKGWKYIYVIDASSDMAKQVLLPTCYKTNVSFADNKVSRKALIYTSFILAGGRSTVQGGVQVFRGASFYAIKDYVAPTS